MDTKDAGRIGGKSTSMKKRQTSAKNLEKARAVVAAAMSAYKQAQDGEEKSALLGELKTAMVDAEIAPPIVQQILDGKSYHQLALDELNRHTVIMNSIEAFNGE